MPSVSNLNPANVVSNETTLREKLMKIDPGHNDFLEKVERASPDDLKKLIVEASGVAFEAKAAIDANETIQALKAQLKEEKGPFTDSIKVSRLREQILNLRLGASGAA